MLFLQPELVQRVEKDLVNIMSGGTVENLDILDTSNFSIIFEQLLHFFLAFKYHIWNKIPWLK